jgi:agmatine deiminase
LKQNYDILKQATDQDGNKLKIIKMPMPPTVRTNVRGQKTRLPASYLNFYVANKVVLVPTYKHKNDRIVIRTIQTAFPGRKVVGIDCRDLIYGMGTIHCVTQQQPALIKKTIHSKTRKKLPVLQ